jgi:hypothetical protein
VRLKLDWTHQHLVYVDEANLLGDSIDVMKINIESLIAAVKEVHLEINVDGIKCVHLLFTKKQVKIVSLQLQTIHLKMCHNLI